MEFDLEYPLTNSLLHNSCDTSDTAPYLFLVESKHMPADNYLRTLRAGNFDLSVRREAISSILQYSCKYYDPSLTYLAVNYLDRFLCSQETLQQKQWILRLTAASCVSLAAKMKKTESSISDFQGNGGLVFDTQTVERMENVILGALKWRMRSITPLSFVSFFITLLALKDPPLSQALKAQATEMILNAQHDIKFLEFKPSVVAAAALLSASHELFPQQFPCFKAAISHCSYVNKEKLMECYNAMQERGVMIGGNEMVFENVSSSDTPVNVLDQHFSGSESDKSYTTASAPKRRKILRGGCC